MSERSFDDFDEFAADYRNVHTQNLKLSGADSFYFAEMKVSLLQEFETNQRLKALDIGCGDGTTEVFMEQYFPAWNVQGIDVSKKSIEEATIRNLSNATFALYDGKKIPLEDNSVDLVFMAGVLHHVAFPFHEVLIKEIVRVLKTGGRFYLYEHNPLNPLTKHLVRTCVFDKDARLLQNGYASKLLAKNKLTVKNKNFIIFFPRKGIFSRLIFLEKYLQWLPLGGQYFIRAIK